MDLFDEELPPPTTQELPVVDYKYLPKRTIEGRLHDLDAEQVELLKRYECAHRGRTPVIRLLTARLRRLRDEPAEGGAPAGC